MNVLQRIDSVQTPKNAVKQWGSAAASIHLVNEGINLVYSFEQNGQVDYLRLTHATLRSEFVAKTNYRQPLLINGISLNMACLFVSPSFH